MLQNRKQASNHQAMGYQCLLLLGICQPVICTPHLMRCGFDVIATPFTLIMLIMGLIFKGNTYYIKDPRFFLLSWVDFIDLHFRQVEHLIRVGIGRSRSRVTLRCQRWYRGLCPICEAYRVRLPSVLHRAVRRGGFQLFSCVCKLSCKFLLYHFLNVINRFSNYSRNFWNPR